MKTIHSYLLLVTAFAIGPLVHAASAQNATWNAPSGNWSTALNWSPPVDPNGSSYNVIFNNGGSLTLDLSRTAGTYSQTGGTFAITNSRALLLSSAGALDGGGVMILSSINTALAAAGNVVFTNSTGTIRGSGQIGVNGLNLLNQANGIIQADVSGQLLDLNGGGTFTNNGLMRAQGGGTLVLDGSTGATFINNATIRSENGSDVSILNSKIVGGTLDNTGSSGTLTLNGGTLRDVTIAAGSTVTTGATRIGTIENMLINHGTLAPASLQHIAVASNTILSGGGVIALAAANSDIYATGGNLTLTNSDNVLRGTGQIGVNGLNLLNQANGIIQADVSGQPLDLNGGGTFTNNGLMRAQNGGTLSFSGSGTFTNNGGTLQALEGTTISGVGGLTFVQTSGTIDLAGGNMNFPSGVDLNGGQLIGNGTFTGPIRNNGGIVGPGHSPGIIAVNGNYTQGTNGTLNIEIGGATAGTGYDQLQVSGTAALGGTLNLSLINGFRPAVGDVFPFILPGSFTGAFSTINTTGFTGQVNYSAGAITITILTVSGTPSPTPTPTPTPRPATLGNISTRLQVGTADRVMIAGFIVQGNAPKRVLIRAAGPSLTQFGVPNALANPQLELHDTSNTIGMNDNWQTTQIGGVITSDQVAEIQNSGLAPRDPLESALIATLAPGSYTAIVQGVNGGTGVGIVEAYDLDATSGSLLANISTRGFVQTGDNAMIGGFIVVTQPTRVIIRAIGPSLSQFGVPDPLVNPQLELHDANNTIARNDDWQTTQIFGIITSDQVAAIQNSQLAPTNPAESAIIATLQPGNYTAIVRGANNTTGNALVEVYALP
ncbi:MAG TPA: hypothetical protein VF345_03805 [Chthoniobacterales bacterium]